MQRLKGDSRAFWVWVFAFRLKLGSVGSIVSFRGPPLSQYRILKNDKPIYLYFICVSVFASMWTTSLLCQKRVSDAPDLEVWL